MTTVQELIDKLSTYAPNTEVMVGAGYDGSTELTSKFDVDSMSVSSLEGSYYTVTEDDGDQDKDIVAIW